MERIESINLERINWCCADMGTTLDELALDLGISASSLDKLRSDQRSLTFNQLRKIASHFGRGILFFLEQGEIEAAAVHSAQFRTIAGQKPDLSPGIRKLIERVEKHRAVYLDLNEEIEDVDVPRFSPPDVPSNNAREAAAIARRWLNLGITNTFDTYRRALESKGILVFRSMGYNGKWQIPKESPILGFTLYDPSCPTIVVKKLDVDSRQSFTLMHELGHILLHRHSSIDDEMDFLSRGGIEREANIFAANLLVPDNLLSQVIDTVIPEEVSQFDVWLADFRATWGVSSDVILLRLIDAGRLPQSKYTAYCDWRSGLPAREAPAAPRVYRYKEPIHIFGERYVRAVLDSLNARRITITKASSYLDNIKVKDLNALGSHYAGS